MARIEEATLFRPDPKLQYPGQRGAGGGGGGGGGPGRGGDDDEGPSIALGARASEAARSAKRRKGLSFVVVMICGALTVLAAIFAPRTYEVESRVLVQRTTAITGGQQQQQYITPEEQRNTAKEYEEQVMSHDNVLAIVRQKNLVARWDDMRQPHRRLIDKINRKLGKPAPTDDEKFEALVNNIRSRMKVWVDATTVTIKLDWSEPEAARDIVDAAVKNFLEARFQSEVGVIPERLKILEAGLTQAHKDLETAAAELVRVQKLNDPNKKVQVLIPQLPTGVHTGPKIDETQVDPALKARLDNVRQQIAVLQEAKLRRVAELNQELIQKRQTLAEGHPDIIALKQTIAATEADPPQLAKLKAEEQSILNDIASKQAAARAANEAAAKPTPRAAVPVPKPDPTPEVVVGQAKNVQDAQVLFDAVTKKYTDLVNQLDAARIEMKTAEAAFKQRYKVTAPAEIPAGPKRPVALIAIAIGILATIAAVLAVAALADRFSGIFYEPRDVRDRLGLPVFATFS